MEGMTELALFGMILVGVALCLLGIWLDMRHRRHEQLAESRRQHVFAHHQAKSPSPSPEAAPPVAVLDDIPEPATHGR